MIYLAGIQNDSIVDGPGIRVTFFAQGCSHHCAGCHNPETWSFEGGTGMETERLMDVVKSNPLCHGVTFSGGEPFEQAAGFAAFARALHEAGYEVASYSGYTFEELSEAEEEKQQLLRELDILIDGPYVAEERSLELNFRGSKNQRILNVPASLEAGRPIAETSDRWLGV